MRYFKTGKSFTRSEIDYKEFTLAQNLLLHTLQNEARGSTLFRADFHGREWQ
jgi:hypothetical protein